MTKRRSKYDGLTAEQVKAIRKEYGKRYYREHREKAKAYQRRYSLMHKATRKAREAKRAGRMSITHHRREIHSIATLQALPPEKFGPAVTLIAAGKLGFAKTGNWTEYTHTYPINPNTKKPWKITDF